MTNMSYNVDKSSSYSPRRHEFIVYGMFHLWINNEEHCIDFRWHSGDALSVIYNNIYLYMSCTLLVLFLSLRNRRIVFDL